MIELGELEKRFEDFAKRGARIVVVSVDDAKASAETQKDFPHLTVVSDASYAASRALAFTHPGAGPGGKDVDAPTTVLVACGEEVSPEKPRAREVLR